MRYKSVLLLIIPAILLSCKKETVISNPPPSPPPPPNILLKDIVITGLPSPFYHFEYDTTGKATFASFASGFNNYTIFYDNDRISEVINNINLNKDRLQYFYDQAGRVQAVWYTDSTGFVYTKVNFSYNLEQLVKLERLRKTVTGFVVDKILTMTYYADGNLQEIADHRPPFNGQPETTSIYRFEHYDEKINVDGFSLVHNDFFDHLLLLPEVKLQKNNPGKETLTGDGIHYTIDYTYTYNDRNSPVTKKGELVFLNGADSGHVFHTNAVFSYY